MRISREEPVTDQVDYIKCDYVSCDTELKRKNSAWKDWAAVEVSRPNQYTHVLHLCPKHVYATFGLSEIGDKK